MKIFWNEQINRNQKIISDVETDGWWYVLIVTASLGIQSELSRQAMHIIHLVPGLSLELMIDKQCMGKL